MQAGIYFAALARHDGNSGLVHWVHVIRVADPSPGKD